MSNFSLPARQVHLDFHTSEHIAGIGARFSRRQFQQALKLGHVNSITVFAKCHHGWSYYPTKVGRRHPHLKFDLLGEQIRACHAIGVRAPVYITVGWSARDAALHPEWAARDARGNPLRANLDPKAKPGDRRPACSWTFLCPSGAYRDLIVSQTMWGGYNKFPIRARKFARQPKFTLAMSGKFHTVWGEFGGFKHPDALLYETASMIAFGARCGIGDQLHPSGEMDLETYRLADAVHPGILKKGSVLFFAHALDAQYAEQGARLHRDLVLNGLRLMHRRPRLAVTLPSCGRVSLVHQPRQGRYVAHLLYAPALQRGRCQVIEDLVPLRNVPVALRVPEKIRRVRLVPQNRALPAKRRAGQIEVVVPEFRCHQAIEFEYRGMRDEGRRRL